MFGGSCYVACGTGKHIADDITRRRGCERGGGVIFGAETRHDGRQSRLAGIHHQANRCVTVRVFGYVRAVGLGRVL